MRIITWTAAARLAGAPLGFLGFYLVTSIFFPPVNALDSMVLAIPYFVSACVTAVISSWLAGRLSDRLLGHRSAADNR